MRLLGGTPHIVSEYHWPHLREPVRPRLPEVEVVPVIVVQVEVRVHAAGVEAASAGVQPGVRALVDIHTAGVGVPGVADLCNTAVNNEVSRSFTVHSARRRPFLL